MKWTKIFLLTGGVLALAAFILILLFPVNTIEGWGLERVDYEHELELPMDDSIHRVDFVPRRSSDRYRITINLPDEGEDALRGGMSWLRETIVSIYSEDGVLLQEITSYTGHPTGPRFVATIVPRLERGRRYRLDVHFPDHKEHGSVRVVVAIGIAPRVFL